MSWPFDGVAAHLKFGVALEYCFSFVSFRIKVDFTVGQCIYLVLLSYLVDIATSNNPPTLCWTETLMMNELLNTQSLKHLQILLTMYDCIRRIFRLKVQTCGLQGPGQFDI